VGGDEATSHGVTSWGTIIGSKLAATPAHGRMNSPMVWKNGLASTLLPSRPYAERNHAVCRSSSVQ
jgi:hypothetical protein